MKKLYFLFALVLCAGALSCKKYSEAPDDLHGTGYIRGRVYLADSLTGNFTPVATSGIQLFLSDSDTGVNFTWKDTSDADGYFLFQHLEDNKKYSLFSENVTGGIIYYQRMAVSPTTGDLIVILSPKPSGQTGVAFFVADPVGNPVTGATVCLFSNGLVPADTSCTGSVWSDASNTLGRAVKIGLQHGQYIAVIKYNTNNAAYIQRDTFTLNSDTLLYRTVRLGNPLIHQTNAISYTITDSSGGALPNVNVCAFTSLAIANDSCTNSNWQNQGDASGKLNIQSVAPGTYYVFFKLTVGSQVLQARDTIVNLTDTTKYTKTIRLHQ